MAKYRKWDNFKLHCGSIHKILSNPPNATDVTKKDADKLEVILKQPEKSPEDLEFIDKCKARKERFLNPPLSAGAKNHLIERYFREKYNGYWATSGSKYPYSLIKGTTLEPVGIEILSRVDNIQYHHPDIAESSDFLTGRPDIFCYDNKKLVDIKITWNAVNFGKLHLQKLSLQAYCQLNGYMEIFGFDEAEVCYMLLNTPKFLVEQKQKELFRKFADGTLLREEFDEKYDELLDQFDFEAKIPESKRIIRYGVKKDNELLDKVRSKMPLCKEFLAEYDRIFMKNNKLVALPEDYKKKSKVSEATEENNPESDPSDTSSLE